MLLARAGRRLTVIALLAMCFVGCSAEAQRYIRFPSLAHPGPEAYQRDQAIKHDPYPLNDVGPEIVGGRPLSYQQPVTEVDRAHMGPHAGVMQPLPPPGTQALAPPVVSSPFAVAPPQVGAPLSTTPAPIVTGPMPSYSAPIATSPYPGAPAPVAAPYPGSSAPVISSPYPAGPAPQAAPFQYQQRAPY